MNGKIINGEIINGEIGFKGLQIFGLIITTKKQVQEGITIQDATLVLDKELKVLGK